MLEAAQPSDAEQAAELIYSSGPNSLGALFDFSPPHSALGFIRASFSQPYGQFGYERHRVIRHNSTIQAICTFWTDQPTDAFIQATLQSLLDYFGEPLTQKIIERSHHLHHIIVSPQVSDLAIGHIAVTPGARRQGLASQLIDYLTQQALAMDKSMLVLDVESSNQAAIDFYQSHGFEKESQQHPDAHGEALGLTPHWHMVKALT